MIARALAAVALAALATLPASAQAPARQRERPAITTDEGGLWDVSDRAEMNARHSGELIRSAELSAYVDGIACRVAAEYCGDIRLYLMQRPYFNASMAPNGYMEVWSGLMLRAEDEAQLAFVLGHEITHYVERHSLTTWRTARSRATAAWLIGLAASAGGVPIVGDIAYLGTMASLFGFSRENESEADSAGFERAVAAGYDRNAGATLWRNLIAETQASDFSSVRRQSTRGSIFASHPVSTDRVEALEALATSHPSEGMTERTRYRAVIRPFLSPWLRDELRRRDWSETLLLINRLADHNEDLGVLHYFRGEVFRLRRGEGDLAQARTAYETAIQASDAPAAAWRELGEIYARDGRRAEAATMLNTYLTRAPDAQDRLIVAERARTLGTNP